MIMNTIYTFWIPTIVCQLGFFSLTVTYDLAGLQTNT